MRYGLFVPNFGPFGDPAALVELAQTAERSDWDGLLIWDHIAWDADSKGPVADPWISLAAVAVATTKLRFGTMITPLARRRPWKLARETATLDRLSGGRLTLGVGLGYPPEVEFGTFGEETDDRVRAAMLDEGLAVLDGLWSGEEFRYAGEHFTVDRACFRPRPVQRPRVPVWCAAWWPNRRPLRRAARWDGVCPEVVGGGTPRAAEIAEIAAYVSEHRSSTTPFDITINGYSGDGAESAESFDDYENAGVTWWLERIDPTRLFSAEDALQRALAGPPRGADKVGLPTN